MCATTLTRRGESRLTESVLPALSWKGLFSGQVLKYCLIFRSLNQIASLICLS